MGRGRYKAFVPNTARSSFVPPANGDATNKFVKASKKAADAQTAQEVSVDKASKIVSHSDDRTAQTDYHFIGVDTTNKAVTITLPPLADIPSGKTLLIKDEGGNASNNAITVTTSDGAKIDGNGSIALVADYASINLYNNGSAWHIY
jgi:hypothetical protein